MMIGFVKIAIFGLCLLLFFVDNQVIIMIGISVLFNSIYSILGVFNYIVIDEVVRIVNC